MGHQSNTRPQAYQAAKSVTAGRIRARTADGDDDTFHMNAVGQLLLYGNVLSEIIHSKVRLALIDNKIYYRTFCAFLNNHLPITLLDFQKDRLFVPYNGW